MNFGIIDKTIEDYAAAHSSEANVLLRTLDRETYANVMQPRMISGHLQGRVLSMLSRMIRPSRILEIGTYTGYSAMCLAEGLITNGILTTIDVNEELETFTRNFFNKSAFASKIDYRIGDAIDIIPTFEDDTFDLVFIDAHKKEYARYYDLVFPKTKQGGFIIADNVLWSGKVFESDGKTDIDTQLMRAFNDQIQLDDRVENVLLTVRDGLMIAHKQ